MTAQCQLTSLLSLGRHPYPSFTRISPPTCYIIFGNWIKAGKYIAINRNRMEILDLGGTFPGNITAEVMSKLYTYREKEEVEVTSVFQPTTCGRLQPPHPHICRRGQSDISPRDRVGAGRQVGDAVVGPQHHHHHLCRHQLRYPVPLLTVHQRQEHGGEAPGPRDQVDGGALYWQMMGPSIMVTDIAIQTLATRHWQPHSMPNRGSCQGKGNEVAFCIFKTDIERAYIYSNIYIANINCYL